MDYLEPEFAPAFKAWKADPNPAASRGLLGAVAPVIGKATAKYGGDPLMASRARKMTLEGLGRYDPSQAKLQTYLLNHLQGLSRSAQRGRLILRAPQRMALDAGALKRAEAGLADELGRPATDAELLDHTGFSTKRLTALRRFTLPATESQLGEGAPLELPGAAGRRDELAISLIHGDLAPEDQFILDRTLGRAGKRLDNRGVAAALGLSPAAVSQRKAKIQRLLDQAGEMPL